MPGSSLHKSDLRRASKRVAAGTSTGTGTAGALVLPLLLMLAASPARSERGPALERRASALEVVMKSLAADAAASVDPETLRAQAALVAAAPSIARDLNFFVEHRGADHFFIRGRVDDNGRPLGPLDNTAIGLEVGLPRLTDLAGLKAQDARQKDAAHQEALGLRLRQAQLESLLVTSLGMTVQSQLLAEGRRLAERHLAETTARMKEGAATVVDADKAARALSKLVRDEIDLEDDQVENELLLRGLGLDTVAWEAALVETQKAAATAATAASSTASSDRPSSPAPAMGLFGAPIRPPPPPVDEALDALLRRRCREHLDLSTPPEAHPAVQALRASAGAGIDAVADNEVGGGATALAVLDAEIAAARLAWVPWPDRLRAAWIERSVTDEDDLRLRLDVNIPVSAWFDTQVEALTLERNALATELKRGASAEVDDLLRAWGRASRLQALAIRLGGAPPSAVLLATASETMGTEVALSRVERSIEAVRLEVRCAVDVTALGTRLAPTGSGSSRAVGE